MDRLRNARRTTDPTQTKADSTRTHTQLATDSDIQSDHNIPILMIEGTD
jgi:hypothetical protein